MTKGRPRRPAAGTAARALTSARAAARVLMEPIPSSAPERESARAVTTISDIARRAGVGVGTVSRVLNRSPSVSEATRQRVLDVIEELEYTPSSVARRLSLGRTLTVAAVVPFVTHASAVERLQGVVAAMRGSAYDLIVFDVETPQQRTDQLRRDRPGRPGRRRDRPLAASDGRRRRTARAERRQRRCSSTPAIRGSLGS